MKVTSAEAAKMLRKLNEEISAVKEKEKKSMSFVAAVGEDIESIRPAYDYEETAKCLNELYQRVRVLKHAINVFNISTKVPGFDMTVDQMLVYIPQLTEKKNKLINMANCLPKERERSDCYSSRNIIEYKYANYDIQRVGTDAIEVGDELAKAQTALDVLNSSQTFEVELD